MTGVAAVARGTEFDPLGAGALLVGALLACIGIGAGIGALAGSVAYGVAAGAVLGVPASIAAVIARYRNGA